VGSVLAAAIYWLAWPNHLFLYGALVVFLFLLGARASTVMEQQLGPDPPPVVIDEMVGFWIALWALPRTAALLAVGFVLFRIFDIWKPIPIRSAERLPQGWGIMADDALSGICTNLLLRLALILRG